MYISLLLLLIISIRACLMVYNPAFSLFLNQNQQLRRFFAQLSETTHSREYHLDSISSVFGKLFCHSDYLTSYLARFLVSIMQWITSQDARVRQLKRTKLALRVKSAQSLRSPHKLKICGDPIFEEECLLNIVF